MKQADITNMTTVAEIRNCWRCGNDFRSFGEGPTRICPSCRKPRAPQKPKIPSARLGAPLTLREKQIVACVCQAKLNKEIAHELHLSVATVKVFMSVIFDKTGVANRTGLAMWALREAGKDETLRVA
jgi:DNA-binding NarL/FixJ family response regulator